MIPLSTLCLSISTLKTLGLHIDDNVNDTVILQLFLNNLKKIPLQSLMIRGNTIHGDNSRILADFISTHPTLNAFDLYDKSLEDNDTKIISNALMKNENIKNILFWGNFTDPGVCALAPLIKRSKDICIVCDRINERETCERIGSYVANATYLESLILEANFMIDYHPILEGIEENEYALKKVEFKIKKASPSIQQQLKLEVDRICERLVIEHGESNNQDNSRVDSPVKKQPRLNSDPPTIVPGSPVHYYKQVPLTNGENHLHGQSNNNNENGTTPKKDSF